jgi:alcohol dehydrogenase
MHAKDCLAAVLTAPKTPLELQRLPLPERLGERELLVRVSCCTICASDLHTYEGRREAPAPCVLGHEVVGEITDFPRGERPLARDGQELRRGDRITWSIAASCGDCFPCDRNLPQKCDRLFKYGHEEISGAHPLGGGLAEYCHLAAGTAVVKIPDAVHDTIACPASCATATVVAVLRAAGGCRGETVLVQGTGMLGLTACAIARRIGAREVIACDVDASRLARAESFGATRSVAADGDGELESVVEEVTRGRGVDVALELSGSADAIETGVNLLRIGGRYIWAGAVFSDRPLVLSAETVVRRLLTIRGVHNYTPSDLEKAVEFLAKNHQRYPFDELVPASFSLSEADRAFRHAIDSRELRVAVIP